jgi:hypothetical protein
MSAMENGHHRTTTNQTGRISVRHFLIAMIALCLFFTAQASIGQEQEQQGKFGLGVILGEPTGLSAKYWTSSVTAFDFGLGWGWIDGNNNGNDNGGSRVHFHMDYLWHSFETIKSTERFPLYYGIGGRVNAGEGYSTSFAVRGVIGVAWMPRDTPIDIFIELAPSLRLTESTGFAIDGGLGARYYF